MSEEEITSTVGFKEEEFVKDKIKFTCYDMSGQNKYRDLWQQYYSVAESIIFIIDAADKLRVQVAKNELDLLL